MKQLKILIAASESMPFAKTGGLADAVSGLAQALSSLDEKVAVFLPLYRQIKEKDFGIKLIKDNLIADAGDWQAKFSLYHCQNKNVDFYFIEKDKYFDREYLYVTPYGDYPDNALRFAFFSNAVLSAAAALELEPDIIHCNDWQTALIPFYLKYKLCDNQSFEKSKVLFSIHNLAYQGVFIREMAPKVGIPHKFFTPDTFEFYGKVNFMKAGIIWADAISTVSKGYAREILTKNFGCELDGLLNTRKKDLYGITNGVNYFEWDPKTDSFLKANYDKESLQNKAKCKQDLLSRMNLPLDLDAPLLGFIGRLAEQKGIDVITETADQIRELGCNLVILGTGDKKYVKILAELQKKYPQNLAVRLEFDESLAHKVEAGADIFLMPSRYEPCGLNQMYSLKYGSVPLVSAVGGLDDTIIDYRHDSQEGSGFKFDKINSADFIQTLRSAVELYKNKKEWAKLVKRIMDIDFSWQHSAKEYIKLYNLIKVKKRCEKYCV